MMSKKRCILLGAPVQEGAGRLGCDMGPSAFRAAGLAAALRDLGYRVVDRGNLVPAAQRAIAHANPAIKRCRRSSPGPRRSRQATYEQPPTACRSCSAAITAWRPARWPA